MGYLQYKCWISKELWFLYNAAQVKTIAYCSWTLAELPRYLFYMIKQTPFEVPTWLLFIRYHFFYVLYPCGILGEIWCILKALPFIKSSGVFIFSINRFTIFNYQMHIILLLISIMLGSLHCASIYQVLRCCSTIWEDRDLFT